MDQKVSHIVMYILAITLVVCVGVVLLAKGITAVPHEWLGVAVAAVLAVAPAPRGPGAHWEHHEPPIAVSRLMASCGVRCGPNPLSIPPSVIALCACLPCPV